MYRPKMHNPQGQRSFLKNPQDTYNQYNSTNNYQNYNHSTLSNNSNNSNYQSTNNTTTTNNYMKSSFDNTSSRNYQPTNGNNAQFYSRGSANDKIRKTSDAKKICTVANDYVPRFNKIENFRKSNGQNQSSNIQGNKNVFSQPPQLRKTFGTPSRHSSLFDEESSQEGSVYGEKNNNRDNILLKGVVQNS